MANQLVPLRHTRQRAAVSAVLAGLDVFLTAQEIHELIREQGEKVGLATIYRTMQHLVKTGEVDVILNPYGQAAYRFCSRSHHHHLICRVCGRTIEFQLPGLETLIDELTRQHGFSDIDHELELTGWCANCANSTPQT